MKIVKLICEKCGGEFERRASEAKRNASKNLKIYCSRKCQDRFKNLGDNVKLFTVGNAPQRGNWRDEYSPFRPFMKSSKMHSGLKKDHTITLQDLKDQWEKQDGICPYTGWKLKMNETMKYKLAHTPDRGSLDRIDSSKGYVKGNIQFVSLIVQYAKNGWDEDVIQNFCEAVVKNKK